MAHLIVNGLFDSEHYWVLSRTASGGTDIVHGENFRGLLVGVIKPGWLKGEFEGINRKHGGGDRAPPSVLRRHGSGIASRSRTRRRRQCGARPRNNGAESAAVVASCSFIALQQLIFTLPCG
jgi:hypothetical protein